MKKVLCMYTSYPAPRERTYLQFGKLIRTLIGPRVLVSMGQWLSGDVEWVWLGEILVKYEWDLSIRCISWVTMIEPYQNGLLGKLVCSHLERARQKQGREEERPRFRCTSTYLFKVEWAPSFIADLFTHLKSTLLVWAYVYTRVY